MKDRSRDLGYPKGLAGHELSRREGYRLHMQHHRTLGMPEDLLNNVERVIVRSLSSRPKMLGKVVFIGTFRMPDCFVRSIMRQVQLARLTAADKKVDKGNNALEIGNVRPAVCVASQPAEPSTVIAEWAV